MDQETLQTFCRQIARWSETAIEEGRYPFRRVELFPPLLTAQGEQRPPLVFWINRDSFMAGGVLVFPRKDPEEVLELGRDCARALGLTQFVVWAPREISIWEDKPHGLLRHHTLRPDQPSPATPAEFRELLGSLLDEMKLSSVLGALPAERLSPFYFANLFQGTISAALPPLVAAARLDRVEHRLSYLQSPEDRARAKGLLTLVRLLALVVFDQLPPSVQPEGLERAASFALDALPPELRTALALKANELPLPADSAVRFHHLFRRLTQLRLGQDRPRAAQALELLTGVQAPLLGGYPFPTGTSAPPPTALRINPALPGSPVAHLQEVAAEPLLGAFALLRTLRGQPPAAAQAVDPFLLTGLHPPQLIEGTLTAERLPTANERRRLTTQLRGAWPTRRFSLSAATPQWAWELLQLLGLLADQGRLDLTVPSGWLNAEFAEPILALLKDQFVLERLEQRASAQLRLGLSKTETLTGTTIFTGPLGERALPWRTLRTGHTCLLHLASQIDARLFPLLAAGELLPATAETWPTAGEWGVFLFSRSSLGQQLWTLVSGGRELPEGPHLRSEALQRGYPLPAEEVLAGLAALGGGKDSALPPLALLDQEVVFWLPAAASLGSPPTPPSTEAPLRRQRPKPAPPRHSTLETEIIAAVFGDGLPVFPEHYLFDHYRPQLKEYKFSAPLEIAEEFFDQITLQDGQGTVLHVQGASLARALILASHNGTSPIALPCDQALTTSILQRYLSDLGHLHRNLLQQTHRHLAAPRTAEALAERIWRDLGLPPWSLLQP